MISKRSKDALAAAKGFKVSHNAVEEITSRASNM
jgi:hypothetical protein